MLCPKSLYIMYLMYIKYLLNVFWLAHPACTEQAMQNPTSPRVCHLPKGAGTRLAGLDKLIFGELILVNRCIRPSCTGLSIGHDRPNRLKRSPMVLPTPLCQRRPRLLKSDQYILVYGVPKMASLTNFPTLYLLRSLRRIVCWPGPK